MSEQIFCPVEFGVAPQPDLLSRFLDRKLEEWGVPLRFWEESQYGPIDHLSVDDVIFNRGLTFINRKLHQDGTHGPYIVDVTRYRRINNPRYPTYGWTQLLTQREEGEWDFADFRNKIDGEAVTTPITTARKLATMMLLARSMPRKPDTKKDEMYIALSAMERERYLQPLTHG